MGNYIVGGILLVIVIFIVRYLAKQWKAGHGFCVGGDCKSCGHGSCASGDCRSCGRCSQQQDRR